MAHKFEVSSHALRRRFCVYVVVAQGEGKVLLYVGKTGDNREGCNPLISRCGNHFSYNDIHSQVRNKIPAHEDWTYTYVFDHFEDYCDDPIERRPRIDKINEMERWLNQMIQSAIAGRDNVQLINQYNGVGYVPKTERDKRAAFRTLEAELKLRSIVAAVCTSACVPNGNKQMDAAASDDAGA